MIRIRESFGAKLLSALLGTVGLLLAVTLGVVRFETRRQVDAVTERTIRSAGTLFEELNELQRQQAALLARPFTEGRRALAMLDAAIEAGDVEYLAHRVEILISGQTHEMASEGIVAACLGRRSLKGFSSDVEVFSVEGVKTPLPEPSAVPGSGRPTDRSRIAGTPHVP